MKIETVELYYAAKQQMPSRNDNAVKQQKSITRQIAGNFHSPTFLSQKQFNGSLRLAIPTWTQKQTQTWLVDVLIMFS